MYAGTVMNRVVSRFYAAFTTHPVAALFMQ